MGIDGKLHHPLGPQSASKFPLGNSRIREIDGEARLTLIAFTGTVQRRTESRTSFQGIMPLIPLENVQALARSGFFRLLLRCRKGKERGLWLGFERPRLRKVKSYRVPSPPSTPTLPYPSWLS